MRTKLDRDIEREARCIARVRENYSTAVSCCCTHKEVMVMHAKLMASDDYRKLTDYRRHAVNAIHSHLFYGPGNMSIYQHLEYRMLAPDGKYYAKFEEWRALFPDGDASLISAGKHFWKGTDKVY
jgi:hypothetical protein